MCACTEPVGNVIGAVCVEHGQPEGPITMLNYTHKKHTHFTRLTGKKTDLLRPLFMGAESCEKSESFVATFGRKLWSITLFLHARYGAMKVLCTGLVEFGGVLVENSKAQVLTADVFQLFIKKLRSPPPEAKKSNTQPLSRTLNLAPSSSHQPICMALNLEVSNKQSACAANRTHARPHGRI